MNIQDLSGQYPSIAALRAERDRLRQQVERLETSLARATAQLERAQQGAAGAAPSARAASGHRLSRITLPAIGILLLGSLTSFTVFQDARSTINAPAPRMVAAAAVETTGKTPPPPTVNQEKREQKKAPPKSKKHRKAKTRMAAAGPAGHRQWGPALWMPEKPATPRHYPFDPVIKQQQEDLLVLGFDIGEADGFAGPRTRQALEEFKALYLSGGGLEKLPEGQELATIIGNYAALARNDAETFNVDRGVVAAIRLSSVRTGIDFPYLMELAAAESNFDPDSQAASSSASGLYQFTRETWLNTIHKHGAQYGLQDYVAQIEFYIDRKGNRRPMVRDEALREHLLALRHNPRISAMMAAETVRDHRQMLAASLDREPGRTDLYLMHFLGNAGALSFLKALDRDPAIPAVELFPTAAKSNRSIFHPRTCGPRTLSDVYELFGEKFDTSLYEGS